MLPAQPNQSLLDGLEVLQGVASAIEPVGSRELARRLDLEPTRVNRLLKTLAAVGLTEQTPDRKYLPGPALHVLTASALLGSGLIARAAGPVERLRAQAPGLTVALGVRWRREVAYLFHAAPGVPLAESIGRTALYPADRSSIGRVLLAHSPDGIELYPDLADDFGLIRARGHALLTPPVVPQPTLAVRVGTSAALALSGPLPDTDLPRLIPLLKHAADQITA